MLGALNGDSSDIHMSPIGLGPDGLDDMMGMLDQHGLWDFDGMLWAGSDEMEWAQQHFGGNTGNYPGLQLSPTTPVSAGLDNLLEWHALESQGKRCEYRSQGAGSTRTKRAGGTFMQPGRSGFHEAESRTHSVESHMLQYYYA
ncbi:hypothetical protein NUW58_g8122 [Xylaria curta]|uniref:Uncharacterized protein n=1 Tax=Xylaria curta TaxID=42375 RepID=A0ACC1NCZ6_9PEZI|nr:hypothetical protein NUW58_g8122 [Xylaria curta]